MASLKPSALFPELPTIAESGLHGFESGTTNAVFVPAKTSAAVIRRLNQEVVRFVNLPDTQSQLLNNEIAPDGNSPAQLAAIIKSEMIGMGKLYKDIGMSLKQDRCMGTQNVSIRLTPCGADNIIKFVQLV